MIRRKGEKDTLNMIIFEVYLFKRVFAISPAAAFENVSEFWAYDT